MARPESARAPYSSPVREEQARATRRAIVAAAGELFVETGYAATTIDAVAARAGVGRKTVFSSVGGKAALLKLAWDWAIAGDDEPMPMAARPAVQAMLTERDPQRLVRMWVAMLLDIGQRVSPLGAAVLAAADVDDEARRLREQIRTESLAGATAFVSHLAGVGGLRRGLSLDRAADACWALVNSVLLHLLVEVRGWPVEEYGDWLARLAAVTLLEPTGSATRPPTQPQVAREPRTGYVATIDGDVVGRLAVETTDRLVVLLRTDVEAAHEDTGAAAAMLRRALSDARDEDLAVVAVCPYARWWLDRHPGDFRRPLR
jgi:AcrR family transcriptional regulator